MQILVRVLHLFIIYFYILNIYTCTPSSRYMRNIIYSRRDTTKTNSDDARAVVQNVDEDSETKFRRDKYKSLNKKLVDCSDHDAAALIVAQMWPSVYNNAGHLTTRRRFVQMVRDDNYNGATTTATNHSPTIEKQYQQSDCDQEEKATCQKTQDIATRVEHDRCRVQGEGVRYR